MTTEDAIIDLIRRAPEGHSLVEPDPFRLEHREEIKELVGRIVRGAMSRPEATEATEQRAESLPREARTRFIEVIHEELESLHEGNFARYRVRPSKFRAWKAGWD